MRETHFLFSLILKCFVLLGHSEEEEEGPGIHWAPTMAGPCWEPCCLITKLWPTLRPHGLYSPPGSSVHGIFPRQEYWSELPFPPPGDLPKPEIKPTPPALAGRFFTTELPGKLLINHWGNPYKNCNKISLHTTECLKLKRLTYYVLPRIWGNWDIHNRREKCNVV